MEANDKSYIFRPEFGNEADIARLTDQHNAYVPVVKLFPPAFQPRGDETILDIACGPGSWAIDVAFQYPDASVIGLDIDESAIRHAMARARSSGYENVTFEVHDATTRLPFGDASVDYINIALTGTFLLKEQWARLYAECNRVLRPGGWLRSVEWFFTQTTSVAFHRLNVMLHEALEKDGRRYVEIAPILQPTIRDAGFVPTPLVVHVIDFSEYSPIHKAISQDNYIAANLALPFIMKYNNVSREEYERLLAEMQKEMMLPGFYGLLFLSDIAARKPE